MSNVINSFIKKVIELNPMHEGFIRSSLQAATEDTQVHLENYFTYCLSSGLSVDYLANCYNTITTDTQLEQIYFRKNGHYRCSRFEEVSGKVYFDREYMKKYMYGLALSSFLWPSHTAIHEFFIQTFPKKSKGVYLEIGPGHGYYFMQASKLGNFQKLVGVDISAASIELTRDIIGYFGVDKEARIELIEDDFLSFDSSIDQYSCIVMGEVLEHVEEPSRFLNSIAKLSSPETHIYITTCVNAPAIDHIYLFRNIDEIEKLASQSGLMVIDKYLSPYANLTIEECVTKALPINVAYILKKE